MTSIFYLILFFLSQANFFLLFHFVKIYKTKDWFRGFFTVTKKLPEISSFREPQDFYLLGFWTLVNTLNFIFLTVGLLSSQWMFFLSTLGILFLLTLWERSSKRGGVTNLIADLLRSGFVTTSQFLIVMNYFHWHITF